ncbi:hypothetical protein [Rheinheimera sp. 4Y26]|uniref:hypothetical protein n=1 Tax=Rheinheimera sp. 4Y26 TaxID=2977811 RepID=UPI0021B0FD2B|nr:hypothetical protein [Rheinheimera sp. 4Y26]MCT6700409.1 hypothetical protein [Rheinheimera sp. 4Y26]
MMNRVLFFIFAFMSSHGIAEESDAPETIWLESDEMVSCTPRELSRGDVLRVNLSGSHGKELALYRHDESLWLFLVVSSPPSTMKPLMSSQRFENVKQIEIASTTTGYRWDNKGGNETIFSKPGKYTLYVSENLESEGGGYKCELFVKNR